MSDHDDPYKWFYMEPKSVYVLAWKILRGLIFLALLLVFIAVVLVLI